jgi:hypothetical protein
MVVQYEGSIDSRSPERSPLWGFVYVARFPAAPFPPVTQHNAPDVSVRDPIVLFSSSQNSNRTSRSRTYNYTATVRGVNNATGVALVEIYALP